MATDNRGLSDTTRNVLNVTDRDCNNLKMADNNTLREILSALRQLTSDVQQLKQGQEKLERGQEKLERGQDGLKSDVQQLRRGQETLGRGQDNLNKQFIGLVSDFTNLGDQLAKRVEGSAGRVIDRVLEVHTPRLRAQDHAIAQRKAEIVTIQGKHHAYIFSHLS